MSILLFTILGKKEYRSGLPLLREIYRPIEESKKYLRRLEYNEEEQSRVDLLEKDYCTFLNIGKKSWSRYSDKAQTFEKGSQLFLTIYQLTQIFVTF